MNICFDSSLILEQNIGKNGLSKGILENKDLQKAYSTVTNNLKNGEYGFTEILKNKDIITKCQKVFDKFSWAKTLVVVGIGGSDLGARMLQNALQKNKPPMEVLFIGDSTDPQTYEDLLQKIDPDKTIVNVISKSGSTTETATAYLILKSHFQKNTDDWTKHFVFTTDEKQGVLRAEADKLNIPTLPVPDNVGGRFSVLSAVGLFPALAMGIDINTLVASADAFVKILESEQKHNIAWQLALINFLYQKGKNIDTIVMMPYVARLELFANWFRQLWAESLGKDNKGILPIKAVGPADQHSQVQFYNQGKWLNLFLFLSLENYESNLSIENKDVTDLKYLDKKTLEEIIKVECDATRFSLANSERPSLHIKIEKLDEQHLGQLIILFELSVVYLAQLLKVNAFDQPGVEAGKKYMYGLLGKDGFKKEKKEIEDKKKNLIKNQIEYKA